MGVWAKAADAIAPQSLSWRYDPVAWVEERVKGELWSKQKEILESIRDNRKTAVHSCHSAGKSRTAAYATGWWLDTHPVGEAFVYTSAPTAAQVKAVLWREINKIHADAGLPGRTNLTEWYIGNQLVAFGRKPRDDDTTAGQGIHALYILVILDEGCGISPDIWTATSTLASNVNSRMFVIGNPDDPNTEFGNVCLRDPGWNVIHIGYKDTPNFTNEKVSSRLRSLLISREWVDDRRLKWGEEDALFISKCGGLFPTSSDPFTIMPLTQLQKCQYLELPSDGLVEAGIDVGGGGDRTVIRQRRGAVAGQERVFRNPDPMATVGDLAITIKEWGVQRVKIDSIGIGWGIAGRLKELLSEYGIEVIPVNVAESPTPGLEDKFLNKRAEIWWNIGRENTRKGTWDLSACDDDTLRELSAPRYEILDSKGKIKVERKKDIIQRMGMSPDSADALLLAFYNVSSIMIMPDVQDMYTDLTSGLSAGDWASQRGW